MDTVIPRPAPIVVRATYVLLGALFLAGAAALALLPGIAASVAAAYPEYADLRTPLLAIAIAFAVLALLAVAVVALLVHRIAHGTILRPSSLRWVDAIVAALACGVGLIVVAFVVISVGQAGAPFLAITQVAACLGLLALACVTRVLRSLLRRAIDMHAELEAVV